MHYIAGIPVVLFLVALCFGGLTGRIRLSGSCCAVADPRRDIRMRAAFEDDQNPDVPQELFSLD